MPYKICATSDLHGWLPEIPQCNLLLIAGDICPTASHKIQYQRNWLMGSFWNWLQQLRERGIEVVGICGNHDFIGEKKPEVLRRLPWSYLEDSMHYFYGRSGSELAIWGCPHTKIFHEWAFMKSEEYLYYEHSQIPESANIILTHGPPYGYGDAVFRGGGLEERTGSPGLTEWIEKNQPRFVFCGHNHGDQGIFQLGKTIIANVAFLGDNYQPKHPPQVFEIEL